MPWREFVDAHDRAYRAEVHRRAFATEWAQLLEDETYDPSVKVDDDGRGRLDVYSTYDPLPSVLALEFGEMLYQLRSALDATIYGAAIRDSGKNPPSDHEKLEFPICRSADQFERAAGKIAPLHEGRRDIVRVVQPYMAEELGDDLGVMNVALGLIHDWARMDRHRKLHVVGSWVSNVNPEFRLPPGTRIEDLQVRGDGFLEHDHQVASFRIVGWEPGMDIQANPDLFIDVAIDEEPRPRDESEALSPRVNSMFAAVRYVIGLIEHSFGPDGTGLNPEMLK